MPRKAMQGLGSAVPSGAAPKERHLQAIKGRDQRPSCAPPYSVTDCPVRDFSNQAEAPGYLLRKLGNAIVEERQSLRRNLRLATVRSFYNDWLSESADIRFAPFLERE